MNLSRRQIIIEIWITISYIALCIFQLLLILRAKNYLCRCLGIGELAIILQLGIAMSVHKRYVST